MTNDNDSGLYGIINSNRSSDDHWGKNCFNSSFPASLACYMLDHDIPAIYNEVNDLDGNLTVKASEISMREVFNSGTTKLEDLEFNFESRYEPYQEYSFDSIDAIDLVVKSVSGKYLRPLEVKLTVLPTSGTAMLPEADWGCEIVVRSATTSYCALGMYDSVKGDRKEIRSIFEPSCSSIGSWTNDFEMCHKTSDLASSINMFQSQYLHAQKPLLLQTIWKTKGQSPVLSENCFDVVVWSDFAFSRLFVDSSTESESTMSRSMRATAKLTRCLWELCKSEKIRLAEIYRQMAFDTQTDKEFAIGGRKWRSYVNSDRIEHPRLSKDVLFEIIQPEFIERLRPERRFDQTLYFTMRK